MATRSTETGSSNRSPLLWSLLFVILIGLGWSVFNYYKTSQQLAVLTDPKLASELNKKQTEEVLAKVGKLIIFPKDKNAVVATINDVELLSTNQDFYREAHNGDKLIIFPSSKKAIIYDEDDNRIVNVGPIVYNNPATEAKVSGATDRLNIEIRNGTSNPNAGLGLRDRLRENASYNITTVSKSAKTDYTGTVIVDLSQGAKSDLVTGLQKELGATVVTAVPNGEAATGAEVLVIVGAR